LLFLVIFSKFFPFIDNYSRIFCRLQLVLCFFRLGITPDILLLGRFLVIISRAPFMKSYVSFRARKHDIRRVHFLPITQNSTWLMRAHTYLGLRLNFNLFLSPYFFYVSFSQPQIDHRQTTRHFTCKNEDGIAIEVIENIFII
jgi:hypothetical protein